MVYSAYSFKNVFNYTDDDIYWCTADIGWITGHSYIVYGPLLNGATTMMFEGVPSYPDFGRFWEICEKHKALEKLENMKFIGRAKNILMSRFNETEPEAHTRLQQMSMGRNEPIHEMAKQIVEAELLLS